MPALEMEKDRDMERASPMLASSGRCLMVGWNTSHVQCSVWSSVGVSTPQTPLFDQSLLQILHYPICQVYFHGLAIESREDGERKSEKVSLTLETNICPASDKDIYRLRANEQERVPYAYNKYLPWRGASKGSYRPLAGQTYRNSHFHGKPN